MKAEPDEWSPTLYGLLVNNGIKPWEFGDLTFPWLRAIMSQGKVEPDSDAMAFRIKSAKAFAKKFNEKLKGGGNGQVG